jgi:hypothetical protein
LVVQALVAVDTQTVVPPLKTSPMAAPAWATAAWLEGPTDESRGARKAGRVAKGGRGTVTLVAAFASATGAAMASAVMTPVAQAARLLIGI